MFVYYAFEEQGSGLVIQGYTDAARAQGHEVCVYGRNQLGLPLRYSLDAAAADAVVFLFEWTTELRHEDQLDLLRLVSKVPRRRRVILDGDGNYNEPLRVGADYNHRDQESSRRWTEICDSITDKICQPTLHPRRPNVRPFLFYAYNPTWEMPLSANGKEFDMLYVGHCKWRWSAMQQVLQAVHPLRADIGRLGVVGHGWAAQPWWAATLNMQDTYYSDPDYLAELAVDVMPPVPFSEVIGWMSRAVFNPVLLRPTFRELRLVTPRMFETPAANTIPLFVLDPEHAREIYGDGAAGLVLGAAGRDIVRQIVAEPERQQERVREIRTHLARHHSHAVRLLQLLEIIDS